MSQLTEIACIRPGAELWEPTVMAITKKYFIYASTHQVYVYTRVPTLEFFTMINQGNTIVCAIAADEHRLVIACNDMKIYLYDTVSFELVRELLLVRNDAPISVEFHYHLEHSLIVLFEEDENAMLPSELRSIDTQNGGSTTLVQGMGQPVEMVCSPHAAEVSILMADGQIRIYGITSGSGVAYERILLSGDLQVYESTAYSSELSNEPSTQSKEIISIINDFRKAPDIKNAACTGLTYDPRSQDYFLASWAFGIHVLFSSVTGQALELFQPETTGILAISYSLAAVGRFYTTDGTTGVFKEWNVSQNQQISETRLSGPVLLRSIVGMCDESDSAHDVLHFIDREGKVIVYRPRDRCILHRTDQNHSEAVLSLDLDGEYFCTGAFDGVTRQWRAADFHFKADIGRQRSFQFSAVKYSHDAVSQVITKDRLKKVVNELGAAVCCCYAEDALLSAQHDGLIIAFDKTSGRPLASVFSPATEYKSNLNDQIYEYFMEEPNIVKQRRYQTDFRIKCMVYREGYVYTGWRDGSIRIMRLSIIKSEKAGIIVNSNFVAQISVYNILKVQTDKDLQIEGIVIDNNILYCGCSAGVFIALDLTALKQMCSSISSSEFNEAAFLKQSNKFFQGRIFVGNLARAEVGAIIPNMCQKVGQIAYESRFFNAICVNSTNEEELDFFNGYDQSKPAKVLGLVDNYGTFYVLAQIGLEPDKMCFKLVNIFEEPYQITLEQEMNPRGIMGLTSVLRIEPFHYVIGGADGVLKVIDYRRAEGNTCIATLAAGKASISCVREFNDSLIIGSYDGAVRIISYVSAGINASELIQVYRELALGTTEPDVRQKAIISQRFANFYLFNDLQDILATEDRTFAAFGPMPGRTTYCRAQLILYSLLSQFIRMTGVNLDSQMEKLGAIVEGIVHKQFLTQTELSDYVYRGLRGSYILYNMGHFNANEPMIQRLRNYFGFIIRLLVALGHLELLTELFLAIELYENALITAAFVSQDYWKQLATEITVQRLRSNQPIGSETMAERFELCAEVRATLFQEMQEISAAMTNCDEIRLQHEIDTYLRAEEFALAKILTERASFVKERDNLERNVSRAIASYYSSNWQPLFAAYELLSAEEYAEASRILLFCGEFQLLIFVLLRLRWRGFDYSNLLYALLYDQIIRFTDLSGEEVLAAGKQDQPIGDIVGESIPFSEFRAFYRLEYNLDRVKSGRIAVRDCKNTEMTQQLVLDIGHYIRYLIACELTGAPTPKHDDTQELAPVEISPQVLEEFEKGFNLYNCIQPKFCRAAAKEINYVFIKTRIGPSSLAATCKVMPFLARHNVLTGASRWPEYGPRKSPLIARLMLFIGGNCAIHREERLFHIYMSQSVKCIRKFHLEPDAAIQEIFQSGVAFYDEVGSQCEHIIPIGGRSVFEMVEKRVNSVFGAISGDMEWSKGYFE